MLTSDQFEINEAWIAVRINDEFIFVKEDPYDVFVLMDAASTSVFGFLLAKVVDEAPAVIDVEDLFKKAWETSQQWAYKLIVTDDSIASNVFIKVAEKNGIPSACVPKTDLSPIIEPFKEFFLKDLTRKRAYLQGIGA